MKILIRIFKIVLAIIIPIYLWFFSAYFFDLDEKQRIIDNEEYITLTTVESIVLEGFLDGYYYYKVIYGYYRCEEYFLVGEIVKTSSVFLPYEIDEEVEFYIDDKNEIYKPSSTDYYLIASLIAIACFIVGLFGYGFVLVNLILLIK